MGENYIKIIDSTYKLLEFFPDNDPLKYKAKEKALEILKNLTLISEVSGWTSLKKEKASIELFDDIEILKSYLQLGKYQGWLGGINFLILLKELEKVKHQIKPLRESMKESLEAISKTGLLTKEEKIPVVREKKVPANSVKEPILLRPQLPESEDELGKNTTRREKILHIINNMGKAQVSDIIKEIPSVTKRTIRRDIDELLKRSKIVRNGEWNKIFYQRG